MMRRLFCLLLCLPFAMSVAVEIDGGLDYPSVWQCDSPKWNWYCDQAEQVAPVEPATPAPNSRIELRDIETAEQLRAELKRREDVAVMNPTEDNMRDYLEAWQHVQEKGAIFADQWRRVVWTTPDLDYTLRRPVNNVAIRTYDQNRDASEARALRDLAKEHGILFFFRSDCPYCHQLAPTLKQLSRLYGIEILPVSMDGGGLPDFPTPTIDQGQGQALNITSVPALFIGSKTTKDIAPIGYGLLSQAEIVNRIFVLTSTKPGDNF
jgi:conjugal transfer pilus assembly protein TraF